MASALGRFSRWHVDIDRDLNPILPASVLPRFPHAARHFLGYRTHPSPHPLGNIAIIFWAAVGIFTSLAIIGAVGQHIASFQARAVPTIIGSFGAAAVLDFYAIESPLAQPRNAVLGQLISSVIGVSVCKLFALSPHFEAIRWLGASLSCALATVAMGLTGTVHPPAGATALMAVMADDVADLGWFLIPPVLLGCGLMLATALLVNNIQRRFPYYWWSPEETGKFWRMRKEGKHSTPGKEMVIEQTNSGGASSLGDVEAGPMIEYVDDDNLVITKGHVKIPKDLYLTGEEKLMLETLSQRF